MGDGFNSRRLHHSLDATARLALEQTFHQIVLTWFAVKKAKVTADGIWQSLELHIFPREGILCLRHPNERF